MFGPSKARYLYITGNFCAQTPVVPHSLLILKHPLSFNLGLYSLFYTSFCELWNLAWQYSDSLSSTNLKDSLPEKKVLIHLDGTEHISYIPNTPKNRGKEPGVKNVEIFHS